MKILLFNFTKRKNSFLLPDDASGTELDIHLLDNSTIMRPHIEIHAEGLLEYNYAKIYNHYYFITAITKGLNNYQIIDFEMDVLASYKSDILAQSQYVAYSSSDYSTLLNDARVPMLANSYLYNSDWDAGSVFTSLVSMGSYILQTISEDGNNFYVMQNRSDIATLLSALSNLSDWDVFGLFSSAMDGIVSYSYIPINVSNLSHGALTTIKIGNWADSGIFGYPISSFFVEESITLSINHHYTDFRKFEPYQRMYLHLPFAGIIPLSIKEFSNSDSVNIVMSGNVLTGAVEYTVSNGLNMNANSKFAGHFGYPIPVGVTLNSNLTGEFMNAISAVGSIATGNAVGAIASVASMASCYGEKQNTLIGGASGNFSEYNNGIYSLIMEYSDTRIEPSNLTAKEGRPCMKVVTLSGLTGYCECINASVALNATSEVIDQVNNLLNGGVYIE